MSVFKHSRLIRSHMFIDDGDGELFISPAPVILGEVDGDLRYIWVEGDRLDLLARKVYGLTQLKHLILMANPKYDSEFDIKAGDLIVIPNKERGDLAWAF